jgi:CelD/BcsL family acetyltransferase involved in cellulose biosynthesis
MSSRPAEDLEAAVVDDGREFATLEEEWEELYWEDPLATPFQSWAWLYSWWESFGGGYGLRIITLRNDEGLLVSLLPLMLRRNRLGFGRLTFLGTGLSDRLDVLVRGGWESEVAKAAAGAIQSVSDWQVADLWDVRPGSAARDVFGGWSGPRTCLQLIGCPVVEAKPWADLLASLSGKRRGTVRNTLRRAEADGVRIELAGQEEASRAARRLVDLHREAWQERDIGPEHLTRRFETFLEVANSRMTARGLGGVREFRCDGEVIVAHLLIFGKDFTGGYLVGTSQKALKRYQVSSLIMHDALNVVLERNNSYLDLGRGEEPYKLVWSSRVVDNERLILGRSLTTWAPYTAYHTARFAFVRYENSERVPKWLKRAARAVGRARRRGL